MSETKKAQKEKTSTESTTSVDSNVNSEAVEKIIRQHVAFGMAAGAIPIPIVDIAAITAIQMDMLRQLANRYSVDFNEERGKSLVSAILGATVGSMLGKFGASAVKAVPGIGTALGIGSQVIFAGASTYSLGKVFQNHFEADGTLFDVDLESMQKKFTDFFKQGKDVASEMQRKQSSDDIIATIEKLKKLRDAGAISEEEFDATKKALLKKLG